MHNGKHETLIERNIRQLREEIQAQYDENEFDEAVYNRLMSHLDEIEVVIK